MSKQSLYIIDPDVSAHKRIKEMAGNLYLVPECPLNADVEAHKKKISEHQPILVIFNLNYPIPEQEKLINWIEKNIRCDPFIVILYQDLDGDALQDLLDAGADLFVQANHATVALPGIISMVARHEASFVMLQEKERELESVLQTQKEMICRFTPDTRLTFVNKAYADAFGKTPDELIGTRFLDLIPPKEHNRVKKFLKTYTTERPIQTYRHHAILLDGSIAWQEWTDYAFFDEAGNLTGFQAVGNDVSREFALTRALIKSEAKERKMIARDLHDHIGQMLTYLKLHIEAGMQETDEKAHKKICDEALDLVIEISKELRNVSYRMVAGFVSDLSFPEIVTDMVKSFEGISKVKVKFCNDYIPDNLNEDAKVNLYRILQESLTNITKHAQATGVGISMFERNDELRLIIRDNGVGADMSLPKIKNGFISIRHRVEMLYGTVQFSSKPGKFFKIAINLPVDRVRNKIKGSAAT